MKTFKEISEEYGVSVDALKRHLKNHVVRHLEPITTYVNTKGECIVVLEIDGQECHPPLSVLKKEMKRITICETEEELAEGRKHSAKIKAYYEKIGEPETFKVQIKNLRKEYPGFRPVI